MTFDPLDLIGREFGKLTVREYLGRDARSVATYRCSCSCGETDSHIASRKNLMSGSPRSCGCARRNQENHPEGARLRYITPEMKRQIAQREQPQVSYKIITHR